MMAGEINIYALSAIVYYRARKRTSYQSKPSGVTMCIVVVPLPLYALPRPMHIPHKRRYNTYAEWPVNVGRMLVTL